jgi:hypothetical protein
LDRHPQVLLTAAGSRVLGAVRRKLTFLPPSPCHLGVAWASWPRQPGWVRRYVRGRPVLSAVDDAM